MFLSIGIPVTCSHLFINKEYIKTNGTVIKMYEYKHYNRTIYNIKLKTKYITEIVEVNGKVYMNTKINDIYKVYVGRIIYKNGKMIYRLYFGKEKMWME